MSSTYGVGNNGQEITADDIRNAKKTEPENRLNNMDTATFIQIMVAELQNQDPMNPTSNEDLLQQVNQISSIQANNKLTSALTALSLGQKLSTASSMIGKTINALSDAGDRITGVVDKVTVTENDVKLRVGDNVVSLSNVTDVLPTAASAEDASSALNKLLDLFNAQADAETNTNAA